MFFIPLLLMSHQKVFLSLFPASSSLTISFPSSGRIRGETPQRKKQTAQSGGGVWGWSLVLCVESLQDILFQHRSQLSAVCTVCSHQWAHWTETKA